MAAGITYKKIESTTLGSDQASIEFTSIPGTYTDLVISLIGGQSPLNDDAITTVKLMFTGSDNFKSGTVATLYGIEAA